MTVAVTDIFNTLKKYRFPLQDELKLQSKLAEAFKVNGLIFEREFRLSPKDIIDFYCDGIGLEVKVKKKATAMQIYRQLERYAENPLITSLVLITSRAMGLPEQIKGKPVYYYHLSVNAL